MIQYAPNPHSDEGYLCLFCGCDHAPRFGPCLACRRAADREADEVAAEKEMDRRRDERTTQRRSR